MRATPKGMEVEWCKNPDRGLPAPDVVFYMQLSIEQAMKRGAPPERGAPPFAAGWPADAARARARTHARTHAQSCTSPWVASLSVEKASPFVNKK